MPHAGTVNKSPKEAAPKRAAGRMRKGPWTSQAPNGQAGLLGLEPRLMEPESIVLPITPQAIEPFIVHVIPRLSNGHGRSLGAKPPKPPGKKCDTN